ncbi:hypothetical protein MIND_01294600 [Mycena indigotica]|uniref:DUF2306 domain-containing protein n=1 Tax=Mycena indigotica TaxID=2126181 RepID=A0A8H6S3C2_9AGAR|nr:uncharacterized protein MIND_01294600 [Mycena indigotica]KAF7290545.1 hypothetical protein MIND_01294600 [Mycena indigotica]
MSSNSRVASTLYSQELQPYSPASPYGAIEEDKLNTHLTSPLPIKRQTRSRNPPGVGVYRSISWILGFHEKYSLFNCFIWGGALVGYSLARSVTMNPSKLPGLLVPGEWFWFQAPMYKINLLIHIYLTTFGGLTAALQFLPAIRRHNVLLHRLNGYGVLFCLIVGNICGAIVGRRSFGGELNAQSAYYILGIMVVYSGVLGIYNVKKDTRRHRKWMLRMVAYFAAVITARLISLAAKVIVTDIGTYFSVWRCDEVLNLLTDAVARERDFPQCVAAGVDPQSVWVTVHASTREGTLYAASSVRAVIGMALWIATLIHMAGVECYIILTEPANQVRLGYALEPNEDSNGPY